ncbi:aminotransferase class I/II-fold pyridoxal phosphate-dependent enzyme [Jeotgalibacillus haloalkalitolerans]|uniref:Aminotransferase class I/II-fold pyridoxal phosphate-dependent enzyme n=1 Tax=Jeotgalibacillus haloalkalitolerans TaxID=3104292 RepID=A0ABU5KR91_9BACL|nr:aminotransferase class I/II-fold pyridoxal phosphate-dependent enzyme [Jeotgalibacillus sp. HH7-29]MDZ5713766.1 aminotransferase class I/II-fold pyridoxal phosphate-dependent enzyme [Jeotgalibacillus sp. HH7-29]
MDQRERPLVEALQHHMNQKPVSFHVPGHKNGMIGEVAGRFGAWDQTEISGLDDLHAPEGPIAKAQSLLAQHAGALKSYFLVNGSTTGNLAMVMGLCEPGSQLLVAGNAHKSVIHACRLARVMPVFLTPEVHPESMTPSGISPDLLNKAMAQFPDAKTVLLTYPSYYGHTGQMKAVIEIAKASGLTVLVDEAHGAHFSLPGFPESTLHMGADAVVQSAHKTLPALTMGSYLHIGKELKDHHRIEQMLGMLQSSSPSYPIMASLDDARCYAATYSGEDAAYFKSERAELVSRLREIQRLSVIEPEDPLKLIIRLDGMNGYDLQEACEERGIFAELADPLQVLWMLPLLKEGSQFKWDRVIQSLREIAETAEWTENDPAVFFTEKITTLAVHDADQLPCAVLPITEAAGRIAAETITPYPPGIPYIIAGERLTAEKCNELSRLAKTNMRFQGGVHLIEGKMKVVQEDLHE